MFQKITDFIRTQFPQDDMIALHRPLFGTLEKDLTMKCIDSTFVSSVGEYVDQLENTLKNYTQAKYAIATVNGTAALHVALRVAGVEKDDEVLVPVLTFIATANSVKYCDAHPVFIDSNKDDLGISAEKIEEFLSTETNMSNDGICINKCTNRKIRACIIMHTLGHSVDVDKIISICKKFNIKVIEDAAESLGTKYKDKHTGTIGDIGILSFNGNKIITTGGGGMILTNDENLGLKCKHLTTTAKIPHPYKFVHDEVGYNYRMPNINAALGCAQMIRLDSFVEDKRVLAFAYEKFFDNINVKFISEPNFCRSNYWLNAISLSNISERDAFINYASSKKIMCRPLWELMSTMKAYKNCQRTNIENAIVHQERVVNIPSSVRIPF